MGLVRIVRLAPLAVGLVISAGCAGGSWLAISPVAHAHQSACDPTAGSPVPTTSLGAVQFLTTRLGVGVTGPSLRCAAATTWLAVSSDGGAHWRAAGAGIPVRPRFGDEPKVAFVSPKRGWVSAGGKLFATADGGAHWVQDRLGGRVADLRLAGGRVVALGVDCAGHDVLSCRVHAWSHSPHGWLDDGLLPVAAGGADPVLAADPSGRQLVVAMPVDGGTRPLLVSRDGGLRWHTVTDPCGRTWWFPSSVAVARRSHVWVLCSGGAAAGSSTKTLYTSPDSGRRWARVAAVGNLAAVPAHGLPAGDPGQLAVVGNGARQWLVTVNGLAASTTSGRAWYAVGRVPLAAAGELATISFLTPTRGWLLAPGAGLWRTRDGRHWARVPR